MIEGHRYSSPRRCTPPGESRQPIAGYPEPIVDHRLARGLALAAYAEIEKEPQ
jgi:hypothetical protein